MNTATEHSSPELLAKGGLEGIEATGCLPSPSGVALEIMRLCQREDASFAQIARVIKSDPALAARVIKAANAPALARGRPTLAIPAALMVLGMSVVRQLALGFSLIAEQSRGPCEGFDYTRFWSRALLVALSAQCIGGRVQLANAEELFSCGLLADIGRLALASLFPTDYSQILRAAKCATEAEVAALERERFATDRDQLSQALLGQWGFPKTLVSAIAARRGCGELHQGESGRVRRIADVLRLAERITDACFADEDARRTQLAALLLDAARLGLDGDALTAISKETMNEWRDWSRILGLSEQHVAAGLAFGPEPGERAADAAAGCGGEHARPLALLVDDDACALPFLSRLVKRGGFRVHTATNGRDALDLAMRLRPRMVITDWVMPEMDGIAFLRALRATRYGRGIYTIILTGLEDPEHLVEAFDAGADDYVAKPLVPRVFEARLRAAQRLVSQQDELGHDVDEIRRFASELAVNNRKLQSAVMTDPLTGVPNRRYAMERIEQEWAAARRRGGPMACIVVDIDHFKRINDTYGHDTGDAVLRNVAQRLRAGTRLQDAVCRIGGEEFLVICPDTSEADALAHAERLRALVAELRHDALPATERPTISLGVASVIAAGTAAADLVKLADRAVYRAKSEGRNRCAIARAEDELPD